MITIREDYKKRLKKVLKEEEYQELLTRTEDREAFFDYLHIMTEIYLSPDTYDTTKESWELEELFSLISDSNPYEYKL